MNVPRSPLFQGRLLKMCLTTGLLVALAHAPSVNAAPTPGGTMSHAVDVTVAPTHTGADTLESTLIDPVSGMFDRALMPAPAVHPASVTPQVVSSGSTGPDLPAVRSTRAAPLSTPVFSLLAANAVTAEPVMPSGSGMAGASGSSFKPSVSSSPVPPMTSRSAVAPADRNKSQTQCHGRRDQIFVAHEDDDLLFMNPDIFDTIRAGGCIQVVYLTAGERGEGVGYMSQRENGVRAAYA
ncbi:PIG-L family deacetylase [Advenella kashmirensis]|uniref:PIG-L family deacetylase n=1 Tax=Advenella kashmirensis TaxID=310575 RepID=UPI0005A150B9|nr:PIG-L family deacetylase [Advenella kashmirensis]